ncbi:30S ribosomal protein S2 [Candidatus Berkelbacteria bacterium RIFCSPHIGHO2_12_FULL_36_9]|uniref:Small ribosomal subunit protein uS2 n=1 Tax=Candidatus Berkelbacteria bacterium RIFCSPHIGHO2_12_FULL_36_9 TaxID=1797469 RepID=A0A1F5EGS3_9BACT|nr:MAG: 30S ribosomal protein S2 [Candidatus Berkelbacteria bacterium RIFCSPHIGHO2_12_FULL_36_9]
MNLPTLEEMMDAGVHFGHKKQRSHPKSKKNIYCLRDGIYVIDLEKTQKLLETALGFLTDSIREGKTILLVGTKKQVQGLIQEVGQKTSMPYICNRWLGGTLTNFETIKKSIKYLEELERKKDSEEFKALTKNERMKIEKEIQKLHQTFDGILNMNKMPDVMFVVDAKNEDIAILEAVKKEIPLVAICDTDANPDKIDYPIPANDDAVKSLKMIIKLVEGAILEGKGK